MKTQLCRHCGQPSVPGLARGQGMCQYHWDRAHWGKEWADRCRDAKPIAPQDRQEPATGTREGEEGQNHG